MIEVLVALAIIAVALAASLRAVGNLASSDAELHRRMLAGWTADNALTELRLTHAWPAPGVRQFDCSEGNLALMCTQSVSTTPNAQFRRVEISVTTPGRKETLAQVMTMLDDENNRSL